ncbi:MAG: hypothetical protein GX483_07290 [Actinomycetaceae bacterium]|nr:hypothetical protein [Actinomycetaceae bacterium]
MRRLRTLIKIATVIGPAAVKVLELYGPQIRRLIKENPEFFETFKQRLRSLAGAKKDKSGPAGLARRVETLREQTVYLYGTANNVAAAEQATKWRTELDQMEKVLPVVDTMERRERRAHIRRLESQLDALAAAIVQAVLVDDIEDADIVQDEE